MNKHIINKKDILYIYQEHQQLVIGTTSQKEIINTSFKEFITPYCLEYLTTLKGRIDAIRLKYKIQKLVPIYIDLTLNLFPIANQKDLDNIYLNAYNIKRITEIERGISMVIFKNGYSLLIKRSYHIINKYYERALSITMQ